MSHHIDYGSIGWTEFEDICNDLWFDEGYRNIRPMGRRKEKGRDSIFIDESTNELTIFQYKCWVTTYDTKVLKSLIRKAINKIKAFRPKKFVLNTAQNPNPEINDWYASLTSVYGFTIDYYDRTWADLRLDNCRQDIRHHFFGLPLVHHTWDSLLETCKNQTTQTLDILTSKYTKQLYVKRTVEEILNNFIKSNKLAVALVDHTGRGKTNLLCHLVSELIEQHQPVVLLLGDTTIIDDNGFEKLLCSSLGYEDNNIQTHLHNLSKLLNNKSQELIVLIDNISGNRDSTITNHSLINLFAKLSIQGCFKIVLTCRDIAWNRLSQGIPQHHFYKFNLQESSANFSSSGSSVQVENFSESEFQEAQLKYSDYYGVLFKPIDNARRILAHPLLLRFFCEANKNQNLRVVSNIPVMQIFENYLKVKCAETSFKLEYGYNDRTIKKLLIKCAGRMWREKSKTLSEDMWLDVTDNFEKSDIDRLRQILEEEELTKTIENPMTNDIDISFVFDELFDYLLLLFLYSSLPVNIRNTTDINNPTSLISYISPAEENPDIEKLITLSGLTLPGINYRRDYLKSILEKSFPLYCSCLTYIPPVGTIGDFSENSLITMGRELARWYGLYMNYFPELKQVVDPANQGTINHLDDFAIGIHLFVSPEYKEISYEYKANQLGCNEDELVQITHTKNYPTFYVAISSGTEKLILHDPEHGFCMTRFQEPGGSIRRVMNFCIGSRFSGESVNIPERIALFDFWDEINNLIRGKKIFDELDSTGQLILHQCISKTKGNISDEEKHQIEDYLRMLFGTTIKGYLQVVDTHFPSFTSLLNLKSQVPFSAHGITDLQNIRYFILPVDKKDEMRISFNLVSDLDVTSPDLTLIVKDDEMHQKETSANYSLRKYKEFHRRTYVTHPIDVVEPISIVLSETPLNDWVRKLLINDFLHLFSF